MRRLPLRALARWLSWLNVVPYTFRSGFNPQSGHIPTVVGSIPDQGTYKRQQIMFLSLSLPLSSLGPMDMSSSEG